MGTIERLEALERAATAGKWDVSTEYTSGRIVPLSDDHRVIVVMAPIGDVAYIANALDARGEQEANAAYIVAARQAFPALLAVAKAAKAYIEGDMSEASMDRYDALVNAVEQLEATP